MESEGEGGAVRGGGEGVRGLRDVFDEGGEGVIVGSAVVMEGGWDSGVRLGGGARGRGLLDRK